MSEVTAALLAFVAGGFAWHHDTDDAETNATDPVWTGLAKDYLRTDEGKKLAGELTEAFVKDVSSRLLKGLL